MRRRGVAGGGGELLVSEGCLVEEGCSVEIFLYPQFFCTQKPKKFDPTLLCNQNGMDLRFCGPKIFGFTYQPEIILL